MIKLKRKVLGTFLSLFLMIFFIAYYQACSPTSFKKTQDILPALALSGNGDSYSGKLGYFNSVDVGNPCQKISNQGQPFPQQQIFVSNGVFTLVRDKCQDITPVRLDAKSIQVDPNGETLIYQGQSFAIRNDFSEFDQVPSVCPAGTVVDSAKGNLFASPLDLTASVWRVHPEIPAVLDGSLEALPKFRVEVTNPNLLEAWRRVSQNPILSPNTQYVMTFLLQAGNRDFATVTYNEYPAGQFVVAVDLLNTQAYIQYQMGGSNPIITSVARYGNAVAVSVAFTSSSSMNGPGGDIGVAPFRPNNNNMYVLGDFIYATAAHLHVCQ